MKQPGKTIVWVSSLDSAKSRNEGRRLVKGLAVQAPRLEEINEAAKRLSLDVEPAPGKARPNTWWEKGGYVIFPKSGSRTDLLRALASEIKKIRAAKADSAKERK